MPSFKGLKEDDRARWQVNFILGVNMHCLVVTPGQLRPIRKKHPWRLGKRGRRAQARSSGGSASPAQEESTTLQFSVVHAEV